jgi:hypothetical protein
MVTELDVLKLVSERLTAIQIQFMLTGSFALAFYATPRMTRDLDLVVGLGGRDVPRVIEAFSDEFYLDPDDAHAAVESLRMFNLMHLQSGIKVDFIVRKDSEYRKIEFDRRRAVRFAGIDTWIVSREDLILSKLLWSQAFSSEMQRRDVAALIDTSLDREYLRKWAGSLGVSSDLDRYLI